MSILSAGVPGELGADVLGELVKSCNAEIFSLIFFLLVDPDMSRSVLDMLDEDEVLFLAFPLDVIFRFPLSIFSF